MKRPVILLFLLSLLSITAYAEDVYVNGYTRKDGTYVEPHYRSAPNAYNWDNKSYTPEQPGYNSSYNEPKKEYNSNWYQPNTTRYQDSNPYNDYQTNYELKLPKHRY